MYDLVIHGGEVVDPGAGLRGVMDVAIENGRIAAVGPDLGSQPTREHLDATGNLVLPGLIDLHTHVYHGATYWGIDPDPVAWHTGVTTWVDAGSAGATTWPGFRDWCIRPARTRILAYLNIATSGLASATHELAHLDNMDVSLCARTIEANREFLVGVKVRMGAPDVNPHGMEPLRRAIEAATRVGLPIMVHLGMSPPSMDELVGALRPGDSITHAFNGNTMRMIGEDGVIVPSVARAWDAGMIVDIGHGAGGFSFLTAEALIGQGPAPVGREWSGIRLAHRHEQVPCAWHDIGRRGRTRHDAPGPRTRPPRPRHSPTRRPRGRCSLQARSRRLRIL